MTTPARVKEGPRGWGLQRGPLAGELALMCLLALLSVTPDHVFGQGAEVRELVRKVEQGDAKAQVPLATRYKEDKGVTRDYQEALKWYRKAAAMADPAHHMKDLRAQQATANTVASSGKEKFYGNLMVAMEEAVAGGTSFKRLPLTGDLARRLGAMFSGAVDAYTGLESSKSRFMSQIATLLSQFGSIVFACHGYFGTKIPGLMEPVLVLTTIPHGKDGFLRMSEVMACRMNANVVALTACPDRIEEGDLRRRRDGHGQSFSIRKGQNSADESLVSIGRFLSETCWGFLQTPERRKEQT